MEYLIEDRIADPPRAGMLDERQCKPFAEHGQMTGANKRNAMSVIARTFAAISSGSSFVPER